MKKDREFYLQNEKIILYGAASIGNIIFNHLSENGYTVSGFIDKRYSEINTYLDLPVWGMDEIPFNGEQITIVVSVKNVFEHTLIAKQLYERGFEKLIFKPYSVLQGAGSKEEKIIGECYDLMLEETKIRINEIPILDDIDICLFKDEAIIEESETRVIANISWQYIYTNDYQDGPMKRWGNVNIMAFFTHINFFRTMLGEMDEHAKEYIDEYVNYYCVFTAELQKKIKVTEEWKKNVISNRADICRQMNLSLELNPAFFVKNAAEATWNEKGYFNLTSGKHRTTFLAAKGHKYIPLSITKDDYRRYIQIEKAREQYEQLKKNGVMKLQYPILQPYFYKYPCANTDYYNTVLGVMTVEIGRMLYHKHGEVRFENISFKDNSKTNGSIGAFYERMGCNCTNCTDKYDVVLSEILDEKEIKTCTELKICKIHYLLIDMDVFEKMTNFRETSNIHLLKQLYRDGKMVQFLKCKMKEESDR